MDKAVENVDINLSLINKINKNKNNNIFDEQQ